MKNPFKQSAKAAFDDATRRERELDAALGQAEEVWVSAVEARTKAVDQDDATLDRLDAAVEKAKTAHQRALERHSFACGRLDEAEAAYEAEEAAERAKRALALRKKVEPRVVELYAEASRAILTTILSIARADVELEAIEARSDDQGFSSVEAAARSRPWLREQTIAKKRVTRWADRHGNPLEDQPTDHLVQQDQGGRFLVIKVADGGRRLDLQKLEFDQVEYREDLVGRSWIVPLAQSVSLPGIGNGDAAIWPPARESVGSRPEVLVRQVEMALARLDSQLKALADRRDDRPVLTRLEPVRLPDEFNEPEVDERGGQGPQDSVYATASRLSASRAGGSPLRPVLKGDGDE